MPKRTKNTSRTPDSLPARRAVGASPPRPAVHGGANTAGAYPLTKKGADGGIDGWLNFLDLDDTPQRAVVQVKGGKVQVGQIRDFCHVAAREKAALGFFICLGDVTEPMRKEATKEGFWTDAGRRDWPKVQILPVADLDLVHKVKARYPSQDKASLLGYKVGPQQKQTATPSGLFADE